MMRNRDTISEHYIREELQKYDIPIAVRVVEEIDSTNEALKSMARQGLKEDFLLIAGKQSYGRGTKGRSFYSPESTGIYMSILLHPKADALQSMRLTIMAAVAQARAIERLKGEAIQIKWPNDIWLHGKKTSGILTEIIGVYENGQVSGVIVGIGINVYEPRQGFPKPVEKIAGALYGPDEWQENLKNDLVVGLLKKFFAYYRQLPEDTFFAEYKKRCFVIGKRIWILPVPEKIKKKSDSLPTEQILKDLPEEAEVIDLDKQYRLYVRYADGRCGFLSHQEISIKLV